MKLYASKAEMSGDAIYEAFKKAGIKAVLNHYPSGENECIIDTTEHDKEVTRKFAEWITSTSHITCDEGEWYVYDTEAQEWHHTEVEELLELYDEQMEEGEEA